MICPHCQDVASFKERRDKSFTTLLGEVRVEIRHSYHCDYCHHGYFPGDAALGLTGRRVSPGAEEVVTLAGTLNSFGKAAATILPKMAGIRSSESTVERITEGNGARLGRFWEQGHAPAPARDWDRNRDASGQRSAYVSVDATGAGQQRPRGAKAEGKVVYIGMVLNPAEFDPKSPRDAQPPEQARYQAGLTDLDTLEAQLRRQAGQVGMDRADQWIGLSYGGQGIETFFEVNFPRDADPGLLPRRGAPERLGQGMVRRDHDRGIALGRLAAPDEDRRGRGAAADAGGVGSEPPECRGAGRVSLGDAIRPQECVPDGLPELSSEGLADRLGLDGIGLQGDHLRAASAAVGCVGV